MDTLDIAEIAHQANKAYCEAMGDTSQVDWSNAQEWQRNSAHQGVLAHLANPYMTPEASHEGWLKLKTEEGWKYGEVKDVEKKEHPCFLPYCDLPISQKAKDFIFSAVVKALIKHLR